MRLATLALILTTSAPVLAQTAPPAAQAPRRLTPEQQQIQQLQQSQAEADARANRLQEEVNSLREASEANRQAAAQGVAALEGLKSVQRAGQSAEQSRVARAVTIDYVQKELMDIEAHMALGHTVVPEDIERVRQDLIVVQSNAVRESGREEVIYLSTAIQALEYAATLLYGQADYFTTRQQLFVAIDNIVAARNSATGNAMPAWRGSR